MEVLSTGRAAKALHTSDDTVRRLIEQGELKAERLMPHGHYRIRLQALREYAQKYQIPLDLPTQAQ